MYIYIYKLMCIYTHFVLPFFRGKETYRNICLYIYMFGSIFLAGKRLYQQFMLFGSFFGPYSKHIFGHILQIYLAMFKR